LFALAQQLQQPPAVGLGYGSYQIRHVDTLAVTNALRNPPASQPKPAGSYATIVRSPAYR
jgi:hypothetical protein